MFAVRESGFDASGNYFVSPNWVAEGVRTGLSVDEIATIDDTGQPLSSLIFHIQTALPFVNSPVIKDPTKAANAKAQTLQTRIDGLMDAQNQFHAGEIQVSVDKDLQEFSVTALPLTILARPPLDADFDKTFAQVSAAQDDFIKANGAYAQVLLGGASPDYQKDALDVAIGPDYEVHQYGEPGNQGWALIRRVSIKGTQFTKVRQQGPRDDFAVEWLQQ